MPLGHIPLNPDALPTVTVVGAATLRAEPDEALVVVSLSALEETPGRALEDVAGRGRALASLLDELAISSADRSTTGVSVHEEFEHVAEGRRSLGHLAVSAVVVRLAALESIGSLVTRASSELAARVDGPRWEIAPENPIRLEVARQAAADGRRRAQAYAEGVGAELGPLIGLAEPSTVTPTRHGGGVFRAMAASSGDMPIESGELEVSAAIEVTFALRI